MNQMNKRIKNIFVDIPDKNFSHIQIESPNEILEVYNGNATLVKGEVSIQLDAVKIEFFWFPTLGVRFYAET